MTGTDRQAECVRKVVAYLSEQGGAGVNHELAELGRTVPLAVVEAGYLPLPQN
jgi:hypothetical protein